MTVHSCALDKLIESRVYSGGAIACTEVAKAISRGELVKASNHACADCGGVAAVYDHRDYNKPLDVEPVCRPCNSKRGKAIPKKWADGEFRQYVQLVLKRRYQGHSYFHDRLLAFALTK